tara:strand:+ start:2928 stop:3437 length:510 start_codon:yes stop_codon:yes gene_type:complete
MDQNLNSKIEIKDRISNFYNKNKIKVFLFISILIILFISFSIIKINNNNNNILMAEKYVKAGLAINSGDKEKTKILLDEIILSKNSFYGILALNLILEKNLISDKNQILNYFEILIKKRQSKENKDIINFKKALFLIKNSEVKKGNELLNEMIKNNSNLKFLAEEVILK